MSQGNVAAAPQESIVLATFKNRSGAERMLASLGRTFRREARAGKADVFVISANADGSLKLMESLAVHASGLVSTAEGSLSAPPRNPRTGIARGIG
jgi:hypothetical protein